MKTFGLLTLQLLFVFGVMACWLHLCKLHAHACLCIFYFVLFCHRYSSVAWKKHIMLPCRLAKVLVDYFTLWEKFVPERFPNVIWQAAVKHGACVACVKMWVRQCCHHGRCRRGRPCFCYCC